jgi:integrase
MRHTPVCLEPFIARWIREMERRGTPSAAQRLRYERQVRTLITPAFTLKRLTRPEIRRWLEELPLGQPNRYRAALMAFCNFLVLEEIIPVNPVRDVPASKERAPRDRHLTPAETWMLCAHLRDAGHVDDAAFQAYLACTAADVRSALAVQVNEPLLVPGTKTTSRARRVDVTAAWRRLWEEFLPVAFLDIQRFPRLGENRLFLGLSYWPVRGRFLAACAALGIEDFHMKDHRHSWAVQAFKDRLPLWEIAQQLGHSSPAMALKVYGRYAPRTA